MPSGDDLYRHLGRRIAELRRARGWSQEALAERVDRNASYLARIESGARRATLDTLQAIAQELGEPIGALFPTPEPTSLPSDLLAALRGLSLSDLQLLAGVARRFGAARVSTTARRPPGRRRKA
jgi:transcriptional regulator with XRE-family HTH domain